MDADLAVAALELREHLGTSGDAEGVRPVGAVWSPGGQLVRHREPAGWGGVGGIADGDRSRQRDLAPPEERQLAGGEVDPNLVVVGARRDIACADPARGSVRSTWDEYLVPSGSSVEYEERQ